MIHEDEHIIRCSECGRNLIVKDNVNNGIAFLSHLKADHGITYLPLYPLICWLRPVGCCLPYEPSNFEKKGSPYTPISFANFTSLFPSSVRLLYTLFLTLFRATSPRFCAL